MEFGQSETLAPTPSVHSQKSVSAAGMDKQAPQQGSKRERHEK